MRYSLGLMDSFADPAIILCMKKGRIHTVKHCDWEKLRDWALNQRI